LFASIAGKLKATTDAFAEKFQHEINQRTCILNEALTASQMLAMSSSTHKAFFKDLNYDEFIADYAVCALESMQSETVGLENAEIIFSSATQYLREYWKCQGFTFDVTLKNEKTHMSVYGKLKFLYAILFYSSQLRTRILESLGILRWSPFPLELGRHLAQP